jgi:hypothetical protein
MFRLAILLVCALQAAPFPKVDIVSVAGCLRETQPGTWMLVNATDPVASTANAPATNDIPATPPVGKNQFRLIGVSEFNLPQHKDRAVIVKGLHVKAPRASTASSGSSAQLADRLNITSVTTISASCPPIGK